MLHAGALLDMQASVSRWSWANGHGAHGGGVLLGRRLAGEIEDVVDGLSQRLHVVWAGTQRDVAVRSAEQRVLQ